MAIEKGKPFWKQFITCITAFRHGLQKRRRDSTESRVNGNQDFNCPSISDNLIDRMTFTLLSSVRVIHPTIMTSRRSCYSHDKHTLTSRYSITIYFPSSNNKWFSMKGSVCACACVCIVRLKMMRNMKKMCTCKCPNLCLEVGRPNESSEWNLRLYLCVRKWMSSEPFTRAPMGFLLG